MTNLRVARYFSEHEIHRYSTHTKKENINPPLPSRPNRCRHFLLISLRLCLASIPSGPTVLPPTIAPVVTVGSEPYRPDLPSKALPSNRPSVNSLMHLYGQWILDACLLQTKDRFTRSATNEMDRLVDLQVCRRLARQRCECGVAD